MIEYFEDKNRFISHWFKSAEDEDLLKKELLEYLRLDQQYKPTQILWQQTDFKIKVDDDLKEWIEEKLLRPRHESGHFKKRKDGYHPLVYVIGHDVIAHLDIITFFEEREYKYFKPKHVATREEGIKWLDEEFIEKKSSFSTPEISYKGVDKDGNSIIEIKNPSDEILNTVMSIKDILEENRFFKENFEKFSSLTHREKEVLTHLALGKKHADISNELNISIHTLREHWKKIKTKLNVKNSNELKVYYDSFYTMKSKR